ncbi:MULTISPECIES: hypothetical protein [Rahnella]|uniref:Uncharacterized protein n=1 Tax=Rahnella laticis TaxID=2787622 RepID=A0ABS0E2S2_9GAMM|nr:MULTISPECIES: hypothetical protein [Rahnella]MBF7978979.1 hypothetical protein [Rahnella laticis]MBF7999069.1 hypothetical protein [Rahnella sp. LAC-M12]
MVKIFEYRFLWSGLLLLLSLPVLTGCPGPGDRMRPDETAQVSQQDESVCFNVTDGKLCIPPSFYRFPDKGQFIVEYLLTSAKHEGKPRNFVVTLEVNHGHVYNVTPTEREISLPYCRYALDTPLAACQR